MKRIVSFFLAVLLVVSIALPAYALQPMPEYRNSVYGVVNGIADWIDALAPDVWGHGGSFRGGGAGRRKYYTQPSSGVPGGPEPTYAPPKYGTGDGNTATGSGATNEYVWNGGSTNNFSIFKPTTNNNYTTNYYDYQWYNPVTNNYQQINQTENNLYYSPTYNTYHITNNEYNTYNKYDTYITNNNTYISYYIVDPVEELSWYYEIYYMLPDGRNSYDLEAKDVWGQYFFYDAVNYQEVAEDDGTTLALLHFDGNILDSSSHNCNVSYETGANYNFAESDFTGALYWKDGVEHKLNITLPESLSGDFTIEGRISLISSADAKPYYSNNGVVDIFDTSKISYSIDSNSDGNVIKQAIETNLNYYNNISDFQWDYYEDVAYYPTRTNYFYYISAINFKTPIIVTKSIPLCVGEVPCVFFGNTYFVNSLKYSQSEKLVYYCNSSTNSNYTGRYYPDRFINLNYFSDYTTALFSDKFSFSVVRHDNKLHYFVDGLEVYSCDCSGDLGNIVSLQGFEDTQVMYDELRVSNKALYTDTYTPSAQPFDTNLVLVVPETGDETTIAVKSNIPVADLRVGGVRPTYPSNGDVYVYLEDDVVKDVQQYQVDGWYSVTASIYENGAWTPFNGKDVSNYVQHEPEPDDPDPTPTPDPGGTSTPETPGGGGDDDDGGFWDFLTDLFGGLIDLLASLVGGAVKLLAGVLGGLVDLFKTLLSFVSGFTDFLTAAFAFLPADMLSALSAGIILMVIIAIIKFIGGFL